MKFVRFGNIKAVKQHHYESDGDFGGFHTAPDKKGFYAMPYESQEFFLIGSIRTTQPHLFPNKTHSEIIWDKWKDIINEIPFYVSYEDYPEDYKREMREANKKDNQRFNDIRREFTLKNEQLIWHHLDDHLPLNEILKHHGSWCLTRVKEYKKAYKKERARLRYKRQIDGGCPFSKDHYEVFIPYNI